MKQFGLIFSFLVCIFGLSAAPILAECPVKISDLKKNGSHITAPGGVEFKIEPNAGKTGWAKIRQRAAAGQDPWTWIPLDSPGKLVSQVKFQDEVVPNAVLVTARENNEEVDWILLSKVLPFSENDHRWVKTSRVEGQVKCEVLTFDVRETELPAPEGLSYSSSIEVVNRDLLASQLGL